MREFDDDELWEKLYDDVEMDIVDAADAWQNGAYTEDGDQVECSVCGANMIFDPKQRCWKCSSCWNTKNRVQWFAYLDANPPGKKCLTKCHENYPVCKNWCMFYKIPDDDPIL